MSWDGNYFYKDFMKEGLEFLSMGVYGIEILLILLLIIINNN